MKLSQQCLFLRDNQNKGPQPYVSTIITHNLKYLNQFWMVLDETFTTGLIFARQSKQGVTPHVLTIITHNPKYLEQFWMGLRETFTTWLIFVRQLKQGVTTLCFEHNYTSLM